MSENQHDWLESFAEKTSSVIVAILLQMYRATNFKINPKKILIFQQRNFTTKMIFSEH